MWEKLSQELNYNVMFSQRGTLRLIQGARDARTEIRRMHTMNVFGADYQRLSLDQVKEIVPILENAPTARLPIIGGVYQPKAGLARHDAVAWAFARMADARGIHIIQNCEVTGINQNGKRVSGVETTKGPIRAKKIGVAVAGHAGVIADMVGLRLPIETRPLQAFVSHPIKPILNTIVSCGAYGTYLMQSDRGELVVGGAADPYPSFQQRGTSQITEQVVAGMCEVFPIFKRLNLMRQWAGMIDISYDNSPIISKTSLHGFYLDVGWGSGGFKAIPISGKMFANLIANDEPHDLISRFNLRRFESGKLILEGAVAANRPH